MVGPRGQCTLQLLRIGSFKSRELRYGSKFYGFYVNMGPP